MLDTTQGWATAHRVRLKSASLALKPHTQEGSTSLQKQPCTPEDPSQLLVCLGSARASRAPWHSSSLSFSAEIQSTLKKNPRRQSFSSLELLGLTSGRVFEGLAFIVK